VGNQRRLGLAAREQHVFVDETKRRGYLLVASVVIPGEVDALRRTLRGLVLPGQRRLHRKDENDRTRRSIAARIYLPAQSRPSLRRWKVDAGDPRVRLGAACTDVHDGGGVRDGQSGVA